MLPVWHQLTNCLFASVASTAPEISTWSPTYHRGHKHSCLNPHHCWRQMVSQGREPHSGDTLRALQGTPCDVPAPCIHPKPGGMPMAGMDGASGTFAPRVPAACNQPSQRDVPQLWAPCNGTDGSDSFSRVKCTLQSALEPASVQCIFTVVFPAHTHSKKKKN